LESILIAEPAVFGKTTTSLVFVAGIRYIKINSATIGAVSGYLPKNPLLLLCLSWKCPRWSANTLGGKMLKPLRDRVVVRPQARTLSEIIHVVNTEKFNEGTVVAVGPNVHDTKVGDFIKYGNGDYLDWPTHRIDGQDYQVIQEADIACIVEAD
jgi:co-chaperonin GroES (HSP10)